jgi:hypothetical protein
MGNPRIKPNYRRRVLRLPDLDHCKTAVLNKDTQNSQVPIDDALQHVRDVLQSKRPQAHGIGKTARPCLRSVAAFDC